MKDKYRYKDKEWELEIKSTKSGGFIDHKVFIQGYDNHHTITVSVFDPTEEQAEQFAKKLDKFLDGLL